MAKIIKLSAQFADLADVFPLLFESYQQGIYYDELSEDIMCNLSYFSTECEDKFVRLEEPQLLEFCRIIRHALEDKGYDGNFNKNIVFDVILYYAHHNNRNPRKEWLEALKWDGQPRVKTYFQRVIGAAIPNFTPEESDEYIGAVTVAWAMGSIARQYGPAQADVIPLLIGDQRIGKSNCLRFLSGVQKWYTDTTSDVTDPKVFLESIKGSAIVELSEATAIRTKESERTKSFISKREDTYRRPYDRTVTTAYRKWVLIATSNLRTPFTDITGNMRYYPIYCEDYPTNDIKKYFNDPEYAMYEAEQFWAEAMQMYKDGATPHLTDEIKAKSALIQDAATKHNDAVEFLNDFLDNDEKFNKKGAFISRSEIFDILRSDSIGCTISNRENFIFTWYNTKGCDWHEARPQIKDALGTVKRPRGFVRKSDATPSYGV